MTDGSPTETDPRAGAVLVELVTALDDGDHERAATLAASASPDDLAAMWSELTDSFGSLEAVGDPTTDGDETRVPLELADGSFVASDVVEADTVEGFRITLSDDASALSTFAGRVRGAVAGVLDPLGGTSDDRARLESASDPADRALAAVDLLAAGRYDELAAALEPPEDVEADPETVAESVGRTWESKVPSFGGVVRTARDGDSGFAFVDGGDRTVRVEVGVRDDAVVELLFTTREQVAQMLGSQVFRGERFDALPETLGDRFEDPDAVAADAERAWSRLRERHGAVERVGDPVLDGSNAAVVDLETADEAVELRVEFDDRWAVTGLWVAGPDGSVAWNAGAD